MERVKRTAYNELRKKIDNANEELRRQIDYRHALTNQIRDNDKITVVVIYLIFFWCHTVSRSQQNMQREPNVKTLRFPFSTKF